MLEPMAEFFEARLAGYDEHMLREIEGAEEFYPFTAEHLPRTPGAAVLDLGCGTGLELEYYLARNPSARITGIDLSEKMLETLAGKFPGRDLRLIRGSYFEVPLGENAFDGAVSVESLHHFTQSEKTGLYRKLSKALKPGGFFLLTDYFASDDEEEDRWFRELARLKAENGITDDGFYHYDTPLTVAHEVEALTAGGFRKVEILKAWGATFTLKAYR